MRSFIAERLQQVKPSATISIADKAKQLKADGKDIIDLSGGDPHFPTPQHIVQAAFEAINRGETHYSPSRGTPNLLRAIQKKFASENGLEYSLEEIIVTPGGKHAIYATLVATVNDGDEVLLLSPAWVSYEPSVYLAGGRPVYIPLEPEDYRITPEILRSVEAPRAKVLIFNTPNNPTGRVATKEEIEAIAEFAIERDLLVISDELYEKILFDGHEHISIATLPGMRERTVTINGVSKSYAMTGWRLGYLAAPRQIASQVLKVHQHSVTAAATFTQEAAACALEGPQDVVEYMVKEYEKNRALVVEALNAIPGIECKAPEGAFYAFPKVDGDSIKFADAMLEKAGVALTPGIAFGPTGEGHVRISFATDYNLLEKAFDRMKRAVVGR